MDTQITTQEAWCEEPGIIYWVDPIFAQNGRIDLNKLKDFLMHQVPNNYFNEAISNTWNPWEVFQVHFLSYDKKETVVIRCKLDIKGSKDDHIIECTIYEPEDAVTPKMQDRAREIAQLISGGSTAD